MTCICTLLLGSNLKKKYGKSSRFLFYLFTAQNVIVVVICTLISYAIYDEHKPFDQQTLLLTGAVPAGLPPAKLPSFTDFSVVSHKAVTATLIGLLEHVAIGKAFATKNNYLQVYNANQEFIACGLANIGASCFGSFPITGSFSRTSVNSEAGVRTPLGGLFTGLVVIGALMLLTPAFFYVPSAALGAIIIAAVIPMAKFTILTQMWSLRDFPGVWIEFLAFFTCFFCSTLISIEIGMEVAIGLTILTALYRAARPPIDLALPEDPRLRAIHSKLKASKSLEQIAAQISPRHGPAQHEVDISRSEKGNEDLVSNGNVYNSVLARVTSLSGYDRADLTSQGVLLVSMSGPLSHACVSHFRDAVAQAEFKFFDPADTPSPREQKQQLQEMADDPANLKKSYTQYLLSQNKAKLRALILDLSAVSRIDFTGVDMLEQIYLQYVFINLLFPKHI